MSFSEEVYGKYVHKIYPGGFCYSICILPQVLVERIGLCLTEDRVPANITSPGSVPTQVWIPRLLLKRDTEGVFTILPQPEGTQEFHSVFYFN